MDRYGMNAVTISTIGDLIDRSMRADAWCPDCGKGRPIDMEKLAERYGRDTTYIRPESPIRIKCALCGRRGLDYNVATR